jgi:hypothetical protein
MLLILFSNLELLRFKISRRIDWQNLKKGHVKGSYALFRLNMIWTTIQKMRREQKFLL